MHQQRESSPSESYFWPVVWAVGLHALMFVMLFVSFAFTPELPPARPIVQTTLYQLKSQSQATTQTNQKIAGEAKKTSAPSHQVEQLETKKVEQQKQAAAEAVKKKAEEAKQVEQKKAAEQKAAEQKKLEQAAIAKKKTEEEKKKKAAEEAKKKAEAEKKKKADEAKKKAAADEAEKKRKAQEAARRSAEEQKALALADLLSPDTERQQAKADTVGDQVAGSLDELIVRLIQESWIESTTARNGMQVTIVIQMLPDGTITDASVVRSSGDAAFDASAVAAARGVGRIPEMRQLDAKTFDSYYRKREVILRAKGIQ